MASNSHPLERITQTPHRRTVTPFRTTSSGPSVGDCLLHTAHMHSAQLPSMDEWLVSIKLERYAPQIKEEGYDELEFLCSPCPGGQAPSMFSFANRLCKASFCGRTTASRPFLTGLGRGQ